MLLRGILGAVTAALVLSAARASAADEPVQFTPASGWTADFADDSCSLERSFTNGTDRLSLRLRQFVPGRSLEVTLASATPDMRRSRTMRFMAADASEEVDRYQTFRSPDGLRGVVFTADLSDRPADSPSRPASDLTGYANGDAISRIMIADFFR